MKHTIEFAVLVDILSEKLYQSRYIVGQIDDKHFIYIWTQLMGDEEVDVTIDMLNQPRAEHGAIIGTAQEILSYIKESLEICNVADIIEELQKPILNLERGER